MFSSRCQVSWWKRGPSFPLSAGDFLAWTQTSHLSCSLTSTTTDLFPQLQFLGSSQKNKAVNKDRLGADFLSGALTDHQLTRHRVSSLHSRPEFLCIYGFFFSCWNIFWIVLLFLEDFFWAEKESVSFLECNISIWSRLSSPMLCGDTVVALRLKHFNHHCWINWIEYFNLYLLFSFLFLSHYLSISYTESQGSIWFPGVHALLVVNFVAAMVHFTAICHWVLPNTVSSQSTSLKMKWPISVCDQMFAFYSGDSWEKENEMNQTMILLEIFRHFWKYCHNSLYCFVCVGCVSL